MYHEYWDPKAVDVGEVGVEGEGVERGAVVCVSVKGQELVVW